MTWDCLYPHCFQPEVWKKTPLADPLLQFLAVETTRVAQEAGSKAAHKNTPIQKMMVFSLYERQNLLLPGIDNIC